MSTPNQFFGPEDKPLADNAKRALKDFAEAYHRLLSCWHGPEGAILDQFTEKYPFPDSFEEVVLNMDNWIDQTTANINQEFPNQ